MRELLSDRELQVVRLVAEGLSNKEISIRLKLSDKTVKNHISHILAKVQLTARTQVAVHALRAGIV
jgi:DNA-binding NarL/FixJ family response regulator